MNKQTNIFGFSLIFRMGEEKATTGPKRMKFYDASTGELLGRTAGSCGKQLIENENFRAKSYEMCKMLHMRKSQEKNLFFQKDDFQYLFSTQNSFYS